MYDCLLYWKEERWWNEILIPMVTFSGNKNIYYSNISFWNTNIYLYKEKREESCCSKEPKKHKDPKKNIEIGPCLYCEKEDEMVAKRVHFLVRNKSIKDIKLCLFFKLS